MHVLDTNAVSALMKGEPNVITKLREASRNEVPVPQPVLAEIAYGISRLPRSKRKDSLRTRFDRVTVELPRAEWTDDVSEALGDIKSYLERRGARTEDFDVAIAAHAVARDAILVTANVAHKMRVPALRIEDWGK